MINDKRKLRLFNQGQNDLKSTPERLGLTLSKIISSRRVRAIGYEFYHIKRNTRTRTRDGDPGALHVTNIGRKIRRNVGRKLRIGYKPIGTGKTHAREIGAKRTRKHPGIRRKIWIVKIGRTSSFLSKYR